MLGQRGLVPQAAPGLHQQDQQLGAAGRHDVRGAGRRGLRQLPRGGGGGDTQRSPARHDTGVLVQYRVPRHHPALPAQQAHLPRRPGNRVRKQQCVYCAVQWVGALPSCAPFEFCPPVPRIQNGYLSTPREGNYRLHSIVKVFIKSALNCFHYILTVFSTGATEASGWRAWTRSSARYYSAALSIPSQFCQATGCWEPNALPKCIDENLLSTWSEEVRNK